MKRFCFTNVCETAIVGATAFGAGVLLTLIMPPFMLCGACSLIFLGAGITCILLK